MPSTDQLMIGLLLPAIVSGGIYVIVAYLLKREVNHNILSFLIAAALGIGFIIGYIGFEGKLTLIPIESIHWLFYLAIVAIGSSTYWHNSKLRGLISQLCYSILIPRILLNSYFQYHWEKYEGVIWWIGLSIGLLIFFRIIQQSFHALPSNATIPFVYLGISVGTALILALSGSIRLALHSMVLVSLIAVLWILTIVLPRKLKFNSADDFAALQISITPVLAILFVGLWLNGRFYAEMPWASFILLAISPLFAQVTRIPVIDALDKRNKGIIQVGLIASCTVIAIGIAILQSGFFGAPTY